VRGDPARAHEWFAFAVQHLPEDIEALAELSRLQLEHGDEASALTTSKRLVELCPDHGGGWYALGHAAARCHDTDLSLSALTRAAELLPEEIGVRLSHGLVLLGVDRVEESIAELQRAVELAPDNREAATALTRALARKARDE
jgi:Flp pilus assembly protein TadD